MHPDFRTSYDYHDLNAAIKNTCLLDPQRNNCPKTVEDLINIEPKKFAELARRANLTYRYYPETNGYTLIARNKGLGISETEVAIFDPRLVTVKNYGTDLDFVDTGVTWCNGKFVLNNPPPFPGPWDEIK